MRYLLGLLLAPLGAFAQSVSSPVDSWWNIVDSTAKKTAVVWPLTAAGPIAVLQQPIMVSGFQTLVSFPASPTPYTLTGVRVGITLTGTGFQAVGQFLIDKPLPPLSVPVGTTVIVTYDAPLSGLGNVTATLGPPPPPPPPPPPSTVSAPGTLMPPAPKIVDKDGATWTLLPLIGGVAGQTGVARDGDRKSQSVEFVTIDKNGVVWQSDFKSGNGWDMWSGGATGKWIEKGAVGP